MCRYPDSVLNFENDSPLTFWCFLLINFYHWFFCDTIHYKKNGFCINKLHFMYIFEQDKCAVCALVNNTLDMKCITDGNHMEMKRKGG